MDFQKGYEAGKRNAQEGTRHGWLLRSHDDCLACLLLQGGFLNRRQIQRLFFPVISLVLSASFLLSGCGIFQPSRKELAGKNYAFIQEPARYQIYLEAVCGNVGMVYASSVVTAGSEAYWDGTAKIYAMDTCFTQECKTMCDRSGSIKAWRNHWCVSDSVSPAMALEQWLDQVKSGEGYYPKTITHSDDPDDTQAESGEYYTLTLKDQPIPWAALCDANVDLLFGGDDYLDRFESSIVTMYFSADGHLDHVVIESLEENAWMQLTLTPQKWGDAPEVDLSQYSTVEGTLSEEWSIGLSD